MFRTLLPLLLVFIAIPLTGIAAYVWLCVRMHTCDVPEPPFVSYFILFAHGGLWFLLLLTSFLWGWSGMSSLGLFYLLFASPFLIAGCTFTLHDVRRDSAFHRVAYCLSITYLVIVGGLFAWAIYCGVTQR